MAMHIALLRGVNVGGNKMIAIADLRSLLTKMGFGDVQSLLQSGNLVFRSDAQTAAQLEQRLEAEVKKRLAFQTEFFVRSAKEWKTVIARNPFRDEAERDPGHLLVYFLKKAPASEDVDALQAAITGREVLRAGGKQAYIVFPDGVGRSRLTHTVIEKKLGRCTGRNWNTVLKLGALVGA